MSSKNPKNGFSTKEAASYSKLPLTTLHFLVRTGFVVPSITADLPPKRGRARRYSFGDIVILRAISRLTESGVSIGKLKLALAQLFERHNEITPGTIPGKYLVTDGKNVYFRANDHSIESLNERGQFVFSFVLDLEADRDEIAKTMSGLRDAG